MPETESQGAKLQVGNGASPEVFSDVPGVTQITGLRSGQATEIDITTLASTRREYQMGLADEGQLTVTLFYRSGDTQQARLETLRATRALGNFKVILKDSTEFAFSGFVLSFPVDNAIDTVVASQVVIRVTGEITKTTV